MVIEIGGREQRRCVHVQMHSMHSVRAYGTLTKQPMAMGMHSLRAYC